MELNTVQPNSINSTELHTIQRNSMRGKGLQRGLMTFNLRAWNFRALILIQLK